MEISLIAGDIAKVEAGPAVVNLVEGVEQPGTGSAGGDSRVKLVISRIAEAKSEEVI